MVELGLGLSIFGAVLAFCPWSAEPFINTKLLAAALGALVSLLAMARTPRNGLGVQRAVIGVWAALILSSVFVSCDVSASLLGYGDSAAGCLTSFAALALVVCAAQMSNLRGERLAAMCVAACTVCAAYAVAQRIGFDPLFAGYNRPFGARAFSTMGGPVLLAPVLAAALPLAVFMSGWRKGLLASSIIFCGLLCAGTRAATGGALAGVAMAAYVSGSLRARHAALGGLAVVVLAAASRAHALASDIGRIELWKIAIHGFREHPLVGWGAGTFGLVMRRYISAQYVEVNGALVTHGHAHSLLLNTIFSHGLLGLAALALAAAFVLSLWFTRRKEDAAAFGSLLAVVMCAQTNPVPMAAWLITLVCMAPMYARVGPSVAPRAGALALAGLALGLVCVQARVLGAECATKAGRVAWGAGEGVQAAIQLQRAAKLNPWQSAAVVAQLDSSRNLVPWMGAAQAAQTADAGLVIARRLVANHPADSTAYESLAAQLSMSAELAHGAQRSALARAARAAINTARSLAPTFSPLSARQDFIAAQEAH